MSGSTEPDFGSDSFLDVITNFVGILIILVMVVGEKAKHFTEAAAAKANGQLEAARAEEASITQEIRRIAAQMQTVNGELKARFAERGQLSAAVTAADRELAGRRAALDDASASATIWNATWPWPPTSCGGSTPSASKSSGRQRPRKS